AILAAGNNTTLAPFSETVFVQDSAGTETNVRADTTVTLSASTGNGTLGGTVTGTILAGTSSVFFPAITYTMAETFTLKATPSGGESALGVLTTLVTVTGPATKLLVNPS